MPLTDEQVERAMGTLLRTGVISAAAVVVGGGIQFFSVHGNVPVDFRLFRGEPADLRGPAAVMRDLRIGNAGSIIQFGLLLLIGTPIARVVFAAIAFAMQKDRTYVFISLIVLAALLYGLNGH